MYLARTEGGGGETRRGSEVVGEGEERELMYEESVPGDLEGFLIYCDLGVLNVKVFDTFPGLEGCMAASDIVVPEHVDGIPEDKERGEGAEIEEERDEIEEEDDKRGEEAAGREEVEADRGEVEDEEFAGGDVAVAIAIREEIASIGSSSGLISLKKKI